VFLWRKITTAGWLESHSHETDALSPERVAIIQRAGSRRTLVEVVCRSGAAAERLRDRFGGKIERLQRDWLTTYARAQKRRPLRVGHRLVVFDDETSRRAFERKSSRKAPESLLIPSGAAFGTGDHQTTAMALRLLEKESRGLRKGWSLADLGTGSGILVLAAHRFGARSLQAIDHDPTAISTVRGNARGNKIRGIELSVEDVTKWRAKSKVDGIVANLYSQLLINLLPAIRKSLQPGGFFIFSGVMGSEEIALATAIKRNKLRIKQVRRRGKWIACSGGL
jgi:ribosomal protein L11 methyltransferase